MRALVLSRYGGPEYTALTDASHGRCPGLVNSSSEFRPPALTPVDLKTRAVALKIHRSSDSSAPSVHGELRAINETGAVRRQEDNRLSDLVGGSRTTGRCLGS